MVALKMVLAGTFAEPIAIARFQQEAEAVAVLQHPNIVQIFDSGMHEGQPYYAMELVEGWTLSQQLDGKPQAPRRAAQMVQVLARAVHYAHEHGIIHRDLKPSNVLLTGDGQLKITDFGLAKQLNAGATAAQGPLTVSGVTLGTPEYMAPEQVEGEAVGPSGDVHALGVILYEMLTGRLPFVGASTMETLVLVCDEEPIAPRRLQAGIPASLETIALKCLRKVPNKRYASAAALADDLQRFLDGEPILAKPVGQLERAILWCRRTPLAAVLLAALVLVIVVSFAGVTWSLVKAEAARSGEEQKRQEADEHRERALDSLYSSRIALADRALAANDVGEAARLLAASMPTPEETDRRGWEWHYLQRLCHAETRVLEGHKEQACCVAYSPDGRYLASAGGGNPFYRNKGEMARPGEVIVWDTATGAQVEKLPGHGNVVRLARFSPSGRLLVSASDDAKFRLWDARTWRLLLTLEGDAGPDYKAEFSGDETRLVTLGAKGPARVWEVRNGKELGAFSAFDVALHLDGRRLAISEKLADPVRVIDLDNGRVIFTLTDSWGKLAISPNGKILAAGSPAVRLWDLGTGQEICTGAKDQAQLLRFSPDSKLLASVNKDLVLVREVATGQVRHYLQRHDVINDCAFSPDNVLLATAGVEQTIRVWDMQTGNERLVFRGHTHVVGSVAFHPQAHQLASASLDASIRVWDLASDARGLTWSVVTFNGECLSNMVFSSDGRRLITSHHIPNGPGQSAAEVWDATTAKRLSRRSLDVTSQFRCPRQDTILSMDGRWLAAPVLKQDSVVKVWEVATGREVAALRGHAQVVSSVALSPDGERVGAGAIVRRPPEPWQSAVRIWDRSSGEEHLHLPAIAQAIRCLAFAPNGKILATGGFEDGRVRLWDSRTGQELLSLAGCSMVAHLAFSPDGSKLAAADFTGERVHVWDTATGRELHSIPCPRSLTCVTYSPDGRRLAAAGYSGEIRIWDARTGLDCLMLRGFAPRRLSEYAFTARVVFSPDGRRIAANNWNGTVNVWDAGETLP
jgi:WD40 repeat protein